MRDLLLTSATKLSDEAILHHADELHLDSGLFRTCTASDRYAQKISNDAAKAAALGISGTPSFVLGRTAKEVEGVKIVGMLPYSQFEGRIQELLSAKPQP